jgi:cytochrome oxidase Cu insertion factor (SCO1/SenC/PrrC family)
MLSIFQTQKFTPLNLAIIIVCACCLLQTSPLSAEGNKIQFSLTNHHGESVTEKDFLGSLLLVFFGYSHCPDICPMNLSIIRDALERLGPEGTKVQPLFITLDPVRDTEEKLGPFLSHFHERLLGLTGTQKQIRSVAESFFVRYKLSTEKDHDYYLIDHTAATYLVDGSGQGLAIFQHNTPSAEIASTINSYIASQTLTK